MTRRLLALVFGLSLAAAPAAAQQPDDLVRLKDTLTILWQRGDAARLVKLSAGSGVDLEVRGNAMGALTGRRAAAALRHLFAAQETVSVETGVPSRVAGADNRAFLELTWEVRPSGGPMSERSTVFIGFVREGSQWKVSQIRVLP